MLLYRRTLAAISLQRLNAVFEAKPVAARAVERLSPKRLPEDVPRQKESLFDAYVTLALAWHSLGSDREAEKWLAEALRLDPARTEEDAKYLYVSGEVTSQRTAKLQMFQRAVELDPRFDVAQFSRAIELEMLWRTRATLERNVAEVVFREYEDVLKTNPGNVGAWSNVGYMRWLLGDTEQAREAFEGGREYKEIKRETYVAELDYGLARVAAEQGDFEAAYRHYESGVSALLAQGVSHSGIGYTSEFYHYSFINPAIMDRFDRYKKAVESNRRLWMASDNRDRPFDEVIAELSSLKAADQPEVVEKRKQALRALISVFKRAAGRITTAEKEILKAWAENIGAKEPIKTILHEGNLGWFAEELRRRCSVQQDPALFEEILASLSDPIFTRLISNHLPAQRIRDAVYAFALDDYGSACYKYYSRFGDPDRLTESDSAFRIAAQIHDEYVLPHYHLYTLIERNEEHIRKVIKLEPTWPDGKLAMFRILVEEVERKRRETSYERQKTEDKLTEKREELKSKESELKTNLAERNSIRVEAEKRRKELERRRASAPSAIETPELRDARTEGAERARVDELVQKAEGLEKELANLRSDVEKLELDLATQSEAKAQELEGRSRERLAESNKLLKTLLPHQWLWIDDKIQGPVFDMKTLDRKDYNGELRWEKEFNALHARALLLWTLALDQFTQGQENKSKDKESDVRKLLSHIAAHFWPEDFDLLYTSRRLAREAKLDVEAAEHDSKIHGIINSWLPVDPSVALSWIKIDKAFDEDRDQILQEIAWPSMSDPHLLYDVASGFEDKEMWEESLRLYETARAKDTGSRHYPAHSSKDYHLRIGRNLLALEKEEAILEFTEIGKTQRSPRWRRDIVLNSSKHVNSPESYRILKSWLEREVTNCKNNNDNVGWQDAQKAVLSLVEAKYSNVAHENDRAKDAGSFGMFPVVTPIALEADATLFPSGEGWDQSHPLLRDYIPSMRDRIEKEQGVRVPGVRVRGNEGELPRNTYLVLLNEIPLVLGTVDPERKFCPRYAELARASGKTEGTVGLSHNPRSGKSDGAWVTESELAAVNGAGSELWDHFQYMTYHLEAVLHSNLASFLGLQEVTDLLKRWEAEMPDEAGRRHELIEQVLPEVTARLRFANVLQGLVKESTPISDILTILRGFQSRAREQQDLFRLIEAVREDIKAQLPGNDPSKRFWYLSPEFEAEIENWVWEQDGKLFFAIEPEPVQTLLSAVRDSVDDNSVIVTRTAGVRPFVRRLVEFEFPNLMTLSSSELRPDLRERPISIIEYNHKPKV
jgi:hypothetical protein